MSKPHLLFLIMHDVGRRYASYGDPNAKTPVLDRIAAEGMRFENHFCNYPLCGPARANLFSGYRPEVTQRFNNQPFFAPFRKRMGPDFKTLPQQFKEHGYRTLGTGFVYHDVPDVPSWSEPFVPQQLPSDLPSWSLPYQQASPNIYRNRESLDLIRKRREGLEAAGHDQEYLSSLEGLRQCRGPAVEVGEYGDDGYYDGVATNQALEWIDAHNSSEPLFCAVGFSATHLPFNAPRRYWDLYDRTQLQPAAYREPPQQSPEWTNGDAEPVQYYTTTGYSEPWRASDEESLELLHGHYATLSYVDAQIGKIVAALESKGMWEETIVIVTSDHGFHDSEHGYWGKHTCRDYSFRVPWLMRIPKGPAGSYRGLSEHIDIYPTLCGAAGIPAPEVLPGKDLTPHLSAGNNPDRRAVFGMRKPMWHDRLQVYEECRSVRTERHRLNTYYDKSGKVLYRELFDYVEDPDEQWNHAETHPELVEELEALYAAQIGPT